MSDTGDLEATREMWRTARARWQAALARGDSPEAVVELRRWADRYLILFQNRYYRVHGRYPRADDY